MRIMDPSIQHNRTISRSHFGHGATINQGVIYNQPHQPAAPLPACVISYPRNREVVRRPDLVNKLDALLPLGQDNDGAALWGLGGSGKTQIALEYAYRRFRPDSCSVFWVHADNEATFANDYKRIAAKVGVDKNLEGNDLYEAVRDAIEAQPSWVIILDNADDLALFGVGSITNQTSNTNSLHEFLPHGHAGTVLWTSRDGRITDVVGPRRAIEVARMTPVEAKELLAAARNNVILTDKENQEVDDLLAELQWLPLAISQAGAYMRRTSTPVTQYLSLLRQGRQRWAVLKANQVDRHRRRGVPNSVLETWAISLDRIRLESQVAHRIMHVLAYIDNQNIPFEVMVASSGCGEGDVLGVGEAVARLRELSFLGLRQTGDSELRYDMHKLVQEATRYGLSIAKVTNEGNEQMTEAYFAGIALEVMTQLFPQSSQETWQACDKYLAHAVRVGDWAADIGVNQADTATLLTEVSFFMYDRGRWREREPVDIRAFGLRYEVLGERHPDTIRSMAELAATYHAQGRYSEAEEILVKVLGLRREVLSKRHPDTISSMASLATTYHAQGRYSEAEKIKVKVLDLRQEVLSERHPDTIRSMAELAATYHAQGRHDEDEEISIKVLDLRREVLGEIHPDTIDSMASLAVTYYAQGRHDEDEEISVKVLDLRRKILGETHPDTIDSMAELAMTYYAQGRHAEDEEISVKVLDLRREVLSERHPNTIRSMAELAATYHEQGRHDEAEKIKVKVLDLRRKILGETHPDTIRSMAELAATYHAQGHYNEAEEIKVKVLDLRREVLSERHPDTISSMVELAATYYAQGRYNEDEEISIKVLDLRREVLGETHPDTIGSMVSLAVTYYAQGRHDEDEEISVKVLDLRQEVLGERHPDTLQAMADLAVIWYTLDRHGDALTLMQQCLLWQRRVLGSDHPQVAQSGRCVERWEQS